ncbi:Rieske Fe-S protein [Thermocatellispora tengchongensis]|uniref:Cytochrome bc1 complex Rieske iron-sulfur subunit n=1 Tax=Thermocatellispora tengchongensis TaxID=1073253 RepID=A0A840PBC1_9ACTN|nr:Rieske (2Fe-2S) protein [Thermocatellispora tengchongensis]MBB5135986.1 Rieske Fe-S protein [Thermocatellispora tengchongensis]
MSEDAPPASDTTRRTMLLGAGGAGLVAVLTACSGYGQPAAQDGAVIDTATSTAPQDSAEESAPADQEQADGGGGGFATTADIPEGGGKVFESEKVVVTQPSAGQFKAFDITCTHQGCPVDAVADGTINCPCHGSKFSISDGSVQGGPATKPLAEKKIKVSGDSISLA